MFDSYKREINYLRISITDRCNLRCRYCMPDEGIKMLKHEDILNFDEIVDFVKVGVEMGIRKVRLTGGEPLVRRGVVDLVRMIANIAGINDLSMTTNGILLGTYAQSLRDAGLNRVNVSLDTLNADRYREITRGGNLSEALAGLQIAKEVGFDPIKLNCVINSSSNEPDAAAVKEYANNNGFQVRFIPRMELDKGTFGMVEGGDGGNCAICNRIRITASGMVLPCLFSEIGFSVRELGAREAILRTLNEKPECGTLNAKGDFYNIGG